MDYQHVSGNDPSGNSNSSLHAGADISNLLLLYGVFMFFHE